MEDGGGYYMKVIWYVTYRPSGTEDVVRVYAEAATQVSYSGSQRPVSKYMWAVHL
jgi:phosphomannomutase